MKIEIVGDVHVSKISSIIMGRGEKYSQRLENCIASLNWAERQAEENDVDKIVYVGDLFDKAELNAEEITSLREIKWSGKPHTLIVGNHELYGTTNNYSSAQVMNLLPNFEVISEPTVKELDNVQILYLPYVFEEEKKTIREYFQDSKSTKSRKFVISHNELKGINYGGFLSQLGFELDDIEDNCDLFINGHLHNGQEITKKIINIGNLTGQNFNEDAIKYEHHIMIVDDKDLSYKYIENPYAFNFYKLTIENQKEIDNLKLKNHSVLNIKCDSSIIQNLRDKLATMDGIEAQKVSALMNYSEITDEDIEVKENLPTVDYITQFKEYIIDNLGGSDLVVTELQKILS